MFSEHLASDTIPLALAIGSPPTELFHGAPARAGQRLIVDERAAFEPTGLSERWSGFPSFGERNARSFLESAFVVDNSDDQELANVILSDIFNALVGFPLAECVEVALATHIDYLRVLATYESREHMLRGLCVVDGCFLANFVVLVRARRRGVDSGWHAKSWSSVLRCALHELGHRVFWPTDRDYVASEVAAEYFAYLAWRRMQLEFLSTDEDIGECRASSDPHYRKISLAAHELVQAQEMRRQF